MSKQEQKRRLEYHERARACVPPDCHLYGSDHYDGGFSYVYQGYCVEVSHHTMLYIERLRKVESNYNTLIDSLRNCDEDRDYAIKALAAVAAYDKEQP